MHPSAIHSYRVAYLVLVTTVVLDAFALQIGLRPVRERPAGRGVSLRDYLRRSTDPASTTIVVGGGCSVIGGITATAGLVLSEVSRSQAPDTAASALIGLLLLRPHAPRTLAQNKVRIPHASRPGPADPRRTIRCPCRRRQATPGGGFTTVRLDKCPAVTGRGSGLGSDGRDTRLAAELGPLLAGSRISRLPGRNKGPHAPSWKSSELRQRGRCRPVLRHDGCSTVILDKHLDPRKQEESKHGTAP